MTMGTSPCSRREEYPDAGSACEEEEKKARGAAAARRRSMAAEGALGFRRGFGLGLAAAKRRGWGGEVVFGVRRVGPAWRRMLAARGFGRAPLVAWGSL
jgi:hypothetical protein